MKIKKYLSQSLFEKSIGVETGLGIFEVAWTYDDVMEVLTQLEKEKIIILGGDVLNKNLEYTYDNWYYQEKDYIGSIEYTRNYINSYYQKNGNDFYYVLVIQDTDN